MQRTLDAQTDSAFVCLAVGATSLGGCNFISKATGQRDPGRTPASSFKQQADLMARLIAANADVNVSAGHGRSLLLSQACAGNDHAPQCHIAR